jgi:hypothetical protein
MVLWSMSAVLMIRCEFFFGWEQTGRSLKKEEKNKFQDCQSEMEGKSIVSRGEKELAHWCERALELWLDLPRQ